MNVWNWTVFNLITDTVVLAEMKEAESDIYKTELNPLLDIDGI